MSNKANKEATHKVLVYEYNVHIGMEDALKEKGAETYDKAWLAALQDDILDFTQVLPSQRWRCWPNSNISA